jgi:chromate reductase
VKLLILEGGIHGHTRNCGQVTSVARELSYFEETEVYYLSENPPTEDQFCSADAYLFITGTYWDSCGSPMQKFIEDFTHLECDARIVGKPVGVIVLCHTVGGKSVLSRLQGILSCEGFLIPPLTGMVVARDSIKSDSEDSWTLADMDTVLKNICKAAKINVQWAVWPVDRGDFTKMWVDINE